MENTSFNILTIFLITLPIIKVLCSEDVLQNGNQIWKHVIADEIDKYLINIKQMRGLSNDAEIKDDRFKRNTEFDSTAVINAGGVYTFDGIKETFALPTRLTTDVALFCTEDLPLNNNCFAVTLEINPANLSSTDLVLYKLQNRTFELMDKTEVYNSSKLSLQLIDYNYYVFVSQRNNYNKSDNLRLNGSPIFKINHVEPYFDRIQVLSHTNTSSAIMWEQKNLNQVFLAVASHVVDSLTRNSYADIYKWTGTYFDRIDSIKTYNAKCLTPFTIRNKLYLAVANYGDNNVSGEINIDSEIYSYNFHTSKFNIHQKLRTSAAIDIKYFCLSNDPRKESFLVIANHYFVDSDGTKNYDAYSVIYKISEDSYFMPFQSIKVVGAFQSLPIQGADGRFVLFIAGSLGVTSYEYDGWRFLETTVHFSGSTGIFGPGLTSLRDYQFYNNSILVVANQRNDGTFPSVFEVTFKSNNSVLIYLEELKLWCKNVVEEIKQEIITVKKMQNDLETLLASTHELSNIGFVGREESGIPNDIDIINMNKQLIDYKEEIEKLKVRYEKFQHFTYTQPETFETAEFVCQDFCDLGDLYIETLNGENLTLLLENSFDLQENLTLKSNNMLLEFEYLAVQEPITATSVNNHNFSALVGNKDFNDLYEVSVRGNVIIDNVANRFDVDGTIDGVHLTNSSVLQSDDNQDLNDKHLLVESLTVGSLNVKDTINGYQLYLNTITKRDSSSLNSTVTDIENLNVDELILSDDHISGVDISDVYNNTLKNNQSEQVITGVLEFDTITADELEVTGMISKASIGKNTFPISSNVEQIVLNRDYICSAIVNNNYSINVPSPDCDFDTSYSNLDNTTGRNENYENQYELYATNDSRSANYFNSNETTIFKGDVFIDGKLIIKSGSLKVSDFLMLFEKFNMSEIINNGLELDKEIVDKSFHYKTPFQVGSIEVDALNGIKPESWWLSNGTVEPIIGHKTFVGTVNFDGGQTINKFNGIAVDDLESLSEANRPNDDTDFVPTVSDHSLKSESLVITNTSKVLENDNSVQVIRNDVVIKNNVNTLTLDIDDSSYINGLRVDEFLRGSTKIDGKVFNADLIIDDFVCDDVISVFTQQVNTGEWCDTVELRPDHSEPYEFPNKELAVTKLKFTGKLDGVSSHDFGHWLLSDGDQVIKFGLQEFKSIEALNGIKIVSSKLNDVNINELFENAIRIDEDVTLENIEFDNLCAESEFTVRGKINGIDFENDVIFNKSNKSSLVNINGYKEILNDFTVDNLDMKGLENICKLFTDVNYENQTLIVNGSVFFTHEPEVTRLNNIDVQMVSNNTWSIYDDIFLHSKAIFSELILHKDTNLTGNLNGVQLDHFNQHYFSLSSDRTVTADLTFNGGMEFHGTVIANKLEVGRRINGVILDQFERNVLTNGTDQIISGVWNFNNISVQDGFSVTGLINELNVTKDILLMVNDPEYLVVNGHTKILTVTTDELLTEPYNDTKIQGVNIHKWYNLSVKKGYGDCNINGKKTFKNGIDARNLIVDGLVNNITFEQDKILLNNSGQTLTGHNSFDDRSKVVFNELTSSEQINGINYTDFIKRQVYTNLNNSVAGYKIFSSNIYGKQIILPEYYGDLNLTSLIDDIVNREKFTAYLFHEEYNSLDTIRNSVNISLQGMAKILKFWKHVQYLGNNIHLVIPLKSEHENEVIIGVVMVISNKFMLTVHVWNPESNEFGKSDFRHGLIRSPIILAAIQTQTTKSGLVTGGLFIVTTDPNSQKDKQNNSTSGRQSKVVTKEYQNNYFNWDIFSEPVFRLMWNLKLNYPSTVSHISDNCYLITEQRRHKSCQLFCNEKLKKSVNCTSASMGAYLSGDGSMYVILPYTYTTHVNRSTTEQRQKLQGNKTRKYVYHHSLDVYEYKNENLEQVLKIDVEQKPHSISAIYDDRNKQYLLAASIGLKIIMYRFDTKWNLINDHSTSVPAKTSIEMKLLATNEVIIFLASPCCPPSSIIWVGGLSKTKRIEINVAGNELKQVIPFEAVNGINGTKSNYYIIVTDKETSVFEAVYTS